ncbi:MAG: protein kinase [Chloroflexota bacterium]|nr:protein kinase [Chloroflexota bacterium]
MALEKIGRYQIIEELGRGGMATVYRANDPNFEREVAVKVLPRAFLHDPQFRVRFEREAKMVAALEHSAIVPVYDFGEEDGQPYIVMRMMAGGDLTQKLEKGRLSLGEATKITIQLTAALGSAHSNGVVHRDLKPGNILFDQYDNAFLSDFGIARLTKGSHTLTGENIIGTPAYMSPEQVQGEKDLDNRSDLYAMGIIFYQMLTGDTPYQATTPAKVMMMHILDPLPNLSEVKPDLSPLVKRWLQKALAKEPDDRFATAAEMGAALQHAVRGESHPTLATAPGAKLGQDAQIKTAPSAPAATVYKPPQSVETPTPAPAPVQYKRKRGWVPFVIGGFVLLGIGAIAALAIAFFGYRGQGPLAMLASPTETEVSVTSVQASPTVSPSSEASITPPGSTVSPSSTTESAAVATITPTNTPESTLTGTPEILTIGGADKIAFVNANNIWMMNVDGSDLEQLTNDGAEKHNLSWTPDGTTLIYISGKCVKSIEIASERQDNIACFETAELLEVFEISPDGTQVAISLNREVYLVPYDVEALKQARYYTDLTEMSECPGFAPLKTYSNSDVPAKFVQWSGGGERLAVMMLAAQGGIQVDLVRIFEVGDCQTHPTRTDEFPPPRFTVDNYDDTPYIQNFGHDGGFLYALTSYARNDGYGHLYLYNADLHKADVQVNPIDGDCCYRDPVFSPDGRYLAFAYQPYEAGATAQLYLVSYASIGTGASYQPLPLPEDFFADPREKPQLALHPAVNPNQ